MRLREQTGWGFAGTLLKESPQERGRKLFEIEFFKLICKQLLKKSPRERGRKLLVGVFLAIFSGVSLSLAYIAP